MLSTATNRGNPKREDVAKVSERITQKLLTIKVAVYGEHLDDLITGLVALKLLAVEQLLFQHFDGLARLDKGLRNASVAPAVAGGDQVGDAARLEEGGHLEAVGEEGLAEADHLLQTDANDGRLGVVAQAEAVGKAGRASDNVLRKIQTCRIVIDST